MEDDLFVSLTREVKEEVVENYLTERRLIELQIEEVQKRTQQVLTLEEETGKRLTRLSYLMIQSDMVDPVMSLLDIPKPSPWSKYLFRKFSKGVRFIRVAALTSRGKYRKLVIEAYRRLYQWMKDYQKAHDELKEECRAVNENIRQFQSRFDLLTILNFLKSLDVVALERKYFLGENFTAEEMSSIDQKLYIRPIPCDKLEIIPPISLPKPEFMDERLGELADETYRKYQGQAKRLMK